MKPLTALALVLLLAACGSSPQSQFFTLTPVPPAGAAASPQGAATPAPAAKAGPPLQVGRIGIPGALDRVSLVTRGDGPRMEVSDRARWIAPLDELIRRALTADLRQRMGADRVLAPGDPTPRAGARQVAVNFQQFSADAAGHVVMEADWLVGAPDARHVTSTPITIQLDAGPGPEAMAAGMSQALGRLADAIAAREAAR
ncbi:MAG: membrane integrity-associated transporter subunit PqiC [Rhodospirillales bacterium]|nr:membrane integrity-associated transporter subunit PqiC [Rhodospirillales bacterium]